MRPLMFLAALASLAFSILLPAAPAHAAGCQYVLGFKTLHDLLSKTVGACLEDEHFNPSNGDSLQQTSGGLLVWRKADNWTAFTDGYHSWINGPYGLQERLNTARFSWEHDQAPAASSSCTVDAAQNGGPTVANGAATLHYTITNHCTAPAYAMLDVSAWNGATILSDASTFASGAIPAGGTAAATISVPLGTATAQYQDAFRWFPASAANPTNYCLDSSTSHCISIDPWLDTTLDLLATTPDGKTLVNTLAGKGIPVLYGNTPTDALGYYTPDHRTIVLSSSLKGTSARVRAAILAHEMRHASDDLSGRLSQGGAGCFSNEYDAFTTESLVWLELWGGNQLPPQNDSIHTELDEIAAAIALDPSDFQKWLVQTYGQECLGF